MSVDLGAEPDFALGALTVSPSTGRVIGPDGADTRVEARVMEVLVVLARAGGRTVTRDQLIEACWAGRVVSDDAVTRVIAKIRQLAKGVDPAPFVLETVPKVGFRLIPAIGAEAPVTARSPQGNLRLFAALAAGAAVLLLGAYLLLRPAEPDGRVEVTPFEVRGSDPAQARLAGLVTDAFVPVLAANAMAGAVKAAPEARATEFIIAGIVDKEGEAPAVTPRIIDRKSGLVLWSTRFAGDAGAEDALADEITVKTAAILRCGLEDRRAARHTMSPEDFGLLLQACYGSFYSEPARAEEAARRLIVSHPRRAIGYAVLASALASSAEAASSEAEASRRRGEARDAARAALARDPRTPRAHVALAVAEETPTNWAVKEAHLQKALRYAPDMPGALIRYVFLLREVGRLQEALDAAQRVHTRADPRPVMSLPVLIILLGASGQIDEAHTRIDRLERIHPSYAPSLRWTVTVWWDDPARALATQHILAPDRDPTTRACFDYVLRAVVEDRRLSELPRTCSGFSPDWQLRLLGRVGAVDAAYAMLDTPLPLARRTTIPLFYPEMKSVRADPRFMTYASRLGLVDYWRTSGQWPDFCAEPDLPYDCRAAAAGL